MGHSRPDSPALVAATRDPLSVADPNVQPNGHANHAAHRHHLSHPVAPPPRPDSPSPVAHRVYSPGNPVADTPPDAAAAFLRPDSPRPLRLPNGNAGPAPAYEAPYPEADPLPHDAPGLPHDPAAPPNIGYHDAAPSDYAPADGDDKMLEVIHLDAIYSVQKMAEVLVQGPDTEREFILFELQQLLDHCLDDTMKILLPVLCEHVPTWNVDLQIKSAKRLFDVVTFQLEPITANMITCASFGVIQAAKGKPGVEFEELYNLWGSILVDVLPNMKWTSQEISDVIAIIDIHADERLFTSRKVAARVLGALAQCLDRIKVEKMILPRAIVLFKDEDVEVRGTIVESLAFIGAALPVRITESEVWPRVERLLEPPEDARIRATAMRTMAHILQAQREKNKACKLFRDLLPPVFARLSAFARKFSAEDQRLVDDDTYLLLEVVSEVFGQFLYTLSQSTRKSFRKEAYKGYAGMATCNGPLIRRNCAFNLPGVANALGERYALELSGLCEFLAKDTDEEVRWILAAGIHQSASLLAPRGHFEKLFTAVCSLLQDENPLVRMNALAHFHELLSAFAIDGSDPVSVRRLAPVFTNLTMLSEGEWRIQRSLAEQLDKCAAIIPPDALLENVLPLLFRLMEQGTPLVREAAMRAIIHALRNIPSTSDRNAAISRFWNEAAKGPFWMRLALLDGGAAAMRVFSRQRFAELFAPKVLSLASDPVANVRIRLSNMLASMAPMCGNSRQYEKALELLGADIDVDVRANMETLPERTNDALRMAQETETENATKFRQEEEFYGFTQRTTNGKNRRGGGTRSRLSRVGGFPSRQPSLETGSSRRNGNNSINGVPALLSMSQSSTASSPNIVTTALGAMSGYDEPVSSRHLAALEKSEKHSSAAQSDDESAGPGDNIWNSIGSAQARSMASDSHSAVVRGTTSAPMHNNGNANSGNYKNNGSAKAERGRPKGPFGARSRSWSQPHIGVTGNNNKHGGGNKHNASKSYDSHGIGKDNNSVRSEGGSVRRAIGLKKKKKRRHLNAMEGMNGTEGNTTTSSTTSTTTGHNGGGIRQHESDLHHSHSDVHAAVNEAIFTADELNVGRKDGSRNKHSSSAYMETEIFGPVSVGSRNGNGNSNNTTVRKSGRTMSSSNFRFRAMGSGSKRKDERHNNSNNSGAQSLVAKIGRSFSTEDGGRSGANMRRMKTAAPALAKNEDGDMTKNNNSNNYSASGGNIISGTQSNKSSSSNYNSYSSHTTASLSNNNNSGSGNHDHHPLAHHHNNNNNNHHHHSGNSNNGKGAGSFFSRLFRKNKK